MVVTLKKIMQEKPLIEESLELKDIYIKQAQYACWLRPVSCTCYGGGQHSGSFKEKEGSSYKSKNI